MNQEFKDRLMNEQFEEHLGSGTFSDVYKVTDPAIQRAYAVKRVR